MHHKQLCYPIYLNTSYYLLSVYIQRFLNIVDVIRTYIREKSIWNYSCRHKAHRHCHNLNYADMILIYLPNIRICLQLKI